MDQKNKPKLKLSIILPVRNEGINIYLMLKILESLVSIPHEVLVVYDDKKDKTFSATEKLKVSHHNLRPVLNTLGKGVINAIKTGIQNAKGKYILILAVDDVGPTLAIEDMIYLLDHGCDFVSCTRYKYGGRRLGGSVLESLVSQFGNKLVMLLSRSAFSDATTGFKMFRANTFKEITLESNPIGWAVVLEMAIKAQAHGLSLGEVPIISIDRLYGGKSSFRLSSWISEYARWFWYGLIHFRSLNHNRRIKVRIPKSNLS
jgi:glycosyltransferase involved in cell wall biosynthesis